MKVRVLNFDFDKIIVGKIMDLKDKIKELRIKNCLTQDQLAEKLNVSRQTISKYELGINEPSIDMLKAMCYIFDCNIDELIEINQDDIKKEKQKKLNRILLSIIMTLMIFGFFIVLVFVRFMPETIPLHYDINFIPDRYGSKYELLIISAFLILPLGIALMSRFFRGDVFDQFNTKNLKLIFNIIAIVAELIFIITMIVICSISLEEPYKYLQNILAAIFGGLFVILAIYSSPIFNKKPNILFGYKTRYSLTNVANWAKLNLVQSIGATICGIIIIILGLTVVTDYSFLYVAIILCSLVVTLAYESFLKLKDKKTKK